MVMVVSYAMGALHHWVRKTMSWWLPLLLGMVLGSLLATLLAKGVLYAAILLVVAVPCIALLIRHPFFAVLIWLVLYPYFLSPMVAEAGAMHWLLHRALIPATLAFVILGGWLGIVKSRLERTSPAEWAMLAFLGLCAISIALWSRQPVRSATNLYDRVFVPFCAYWLIRLTVHEEWNLRWFVWAGFVTIVIQVSVSLVGRFAPELMPFVYEFTTWSQGRSVGTLRTAEVYCSTLVFLALLVYHYALSCHEGWRSALLRALFGVAIFSVFLSFSRSSWVGAMVAVAGLLLVYPKQTARLVLVILLLAVIVGGSLLTDELAWANERLTSELAQRSVEGRVIVNNAMIEMVMDQPVVGWGYNRYRYYIAQYMHPVGEISAVGRWHNTSHNAYLTIMTELGVPALLAYLFPAGWWLVQSLRSRNRLASEGLWSWRLVAVLWLAILHMLIENNAVDMISHNPFGTTLSWMALGLIAAVVSAQVKAGAHSIDGSAEPSAG